MVSVIQLSKQATCWHCNRYFTQMVFSISSNYSCKFHITCTILLFFFFFFFSKIEAPNLYMIFECLFNAPPPQIKVLFFEVFDVSLQVVRMQGSSSRMCVVSTWVAGASTSVSSSLYLPSWGRPSSTGSSCLTSSTALSSSSTVGNDNNIIIFIYGAI